MTEGSPDSALLNGPSSGPPQYSPGLHVPPATVVASLPSMLTFSCATCSVVSVRFDELVSAIDIAAFDGQRRRHDALWQSAFPLTFCAPSVSV